MQTGDRFIEKNHNQEQFLTLARTASVTRTTGETDVQVALNLDGTGQCHADTGIPFLDHMLQQISSHGLIDLEIKATGDIEIDDHQSFRRSPRHSPFWSFCCSFG